MSTMSFMVPSPAALAETGRESALKAWMRRHRPQLRSFSVDDENFGNTVMVLAKDGLQVRFVSDRGNLLVDVGDGGQWVEVGRVAAEVTGQRSTWPAFDPLADPEAVQAAVVALNHAERRQADDVSALEALGFKTDNGRSGHSGQFVGLE